MILWIFSSLVGTWGQSGALFIREISSGIKMDTDFFKNNESHTVILLFAERVHGKMRHNANNAGQASWRGKRSSPSSSSSSFFIAWSGKLNLLHDQGITLLSHPKLPDEEKETPTLKGRIWSSPCVEVYINDFGLTYLNTKLRNILLAVKFNCLVNFYRCL